MLRLVLLALLLAPPPETHSPGSRQGAPDQDALLARAGELWHAKGDLDGALAAFDAAVALDDQDLDARLQRAMFLLWLTDAVVEEQKEPFRERARLDLDFVATKEPDSRRAGIARDALARLSGAELFPEAEVECSEEATAALILASQRFQAGALEDALEDYRRAAELCPDNATLWMYTANTCYALGRHEEARVLFRKALAIDPWSKTAHRFLADVEWKLGDLEAALHEAVLAVVSDPTYEAAWATLRDFAQASERPFHRVYRRKAAVVAGSEGASLELRIPEGQGEEATRAWRAYAERRAADVEERGRGVPDPDPLAAERFAVVSALEALAADGEDAAEPDDPFWRLFARARTAGRLDEAILLHLVDADLAPVYLRFRSEHGARLVEYVERLLVPGNRPDEPDENRE